MNDIKKLRLKVMPTVNAEELCKEHLIKVFSNFRECTRKGRSNCQKMIKTQSTRYFHDAVAVDTSAISASSCKKLQSMGRAFE